MAADLRYHWCGSYYLGEGRRWLRRGIGDAAVPNDVRARALWVCGWLAVLQGDLVAATSFLEESRALGERLGTDSVLAYTALFSGMIEMYRGDAESAIGRYEEAVAGHRATGDPSGLALALMRLSLGCHFVGDTQRAIDIAEEGVALSDAYGEGWHRAFTMIALGIEVWCTGDTRRAASLEKESLRFNRALEDWLGVGASLEALAWIAATEGDHVRAARLLGIRQTTWPAIAAPLNGFGGLYRYHEECSARAEEALGAQRFHTAVQYGAGLPLSEAFAYALEEAPPRRERPAGTRRCSPLTPRETEIARLIAEGMSNKQIASALLIAQRTAEGHVERILNKLGFGSRTQIARWFLEQSRAGEL
jgi:DNA-binding CsgD family transcriptional regulator